MLDRQKEHLHLKLICISLLTADTNDIYGRYPKWIVRQFYRSQFKVKIKTQLTPRPPPQQQKQQQHH
jgi:hypothetical protein